MSTSSDVMGERSHDPEGAAITDVIGEDYGTIPAELSETVVKFYRGWQAYETEHNGPPIIDFDLSDLEGRQTFRSREQILSEITELIEQCDRLALQEAEFLSSRLKGSSVYLRTLMGEQTAFATYVLGTMGAEPVPFSDSVLREAGSDVQNELSAMGLQYVPEAQDALRKRHLTDPKDIRHEILSQRDLWLGRLADAGIPVPGQMPLRVKFATVDAYWSNWIEGSSRHGLTLTINLHSRVHYDKGRALFLCLHEICGHAVQMSIWRHRIQAGEISQACGITTVHSPEAVLAEGLGQTVSYLLSEYDFSESFRVGRAVRYHTLLTLHNAHIRLYQGVPVREILSDLREMLPFSTREELESQLRDRGTNLLFRTYLLSYSIGENAIRSLIGRNRSRKLDLFRQIYTVPMTLAQLERFAQLHLPSA